MNINRRGFIETAAGVTLAAGTATTTPSAGAAASPLTEAALEAAAQAPVLRRDGLPDPVIIEDIRLLRKGRDYIVHVRAKNGAEGIALANSRAAYVYPMLEHCVIPFFKGKDARDLDNLLWELYRHNSNYKLQGLAFWCCQAYVEFALLDMLGRIANKPMGALLGDVVRKEVPFYIASGRRDSTPEEEVDYLKKIVAESGAHALKFRAGGRMSRNEDAMPGRTKNLIPMVRKAFGDDFGIHADSNSSYDPPQAIEVGHMLEDIGAIFFEEPCPFDHFEDTKRVADALSIPVAGGEQEYSERRFRWAIYNRGLDVVQPDLQYCGGLIRSTRTARMAALAGIPTTVHISGGFGFVYMVHFASITPDIGRYQEYKSGVEQYGAWFEPAIEIRNGAITVPTGPGVGIKNMQAVLDGAEVIV